MSHTSTHVEANGQKAPRAPKRKSLIDHSTRTVRIEGAGICGLDDLPDDVQTHCALVGLRAILLAADHPGDRFDDLCVGKLPARGKPGSAGKSPAPRSKLRRAIARALVERSRGSKAPFTEEAATQAALTMDRKKALAARRDPLVTQHMQALAKKQVSVLDLIG